MTPGGKEKAAQPLANCSGLNHDKGSEFWTAVSLLSPSFDPEDLSKQDGLVRYVFSLTSADQLGGVSFPEWLIWVPLVICFPAVP